ncbi:MAG: hypothetical protein Q8R98_13980 [Rubrivivax sp.]|nr:hypothetical protein [Rubrivivax sp.]MDP3612961.1 hypothetical protein [Rubrivivax sp.]
MEHDAKTDKLPAAPGPEGDAQAQRRALLDAQRQAHQDQPRSFKDDALTDKIVTVEPDGTGPTPTRSFDPEADETDTRPDATGSSKPR